jgi:iron-sulfur cluster assembly protein
MQKILPVNITKKAIKEVRNIMTNKGIPDDYGLRIGIKGGGGCLGFTYMLGFDKLKKGDDEYMMDNIPVYIEKKHLMYLIDVELDYTSTSESQGFSFSKNNG